MLNGFRDTPQFKFFREESQEWEIVPVERWRWEAYYNDGTMMFQFDPTTRLFHQFKEIDQSKLSVFKMVSDHKPPLTLLFEPKKMKLIHFYRNTRLRVGASNEATMKWYCFGYEKGGEKLINVILDSNEVVTTTNMDRLKIQ